MSVAVIFTHTSIFVFPSRWDSEVQLNFSPRESVMENFQPVIDLYTTEKLFI